jgi:type IV pilus assembly protein PilB
MTSQELVNALVEDGALSALEGRALIREAGELNKGAEEIIYSRNLADEEVVARAKAKLLKVPYRKVDPATIDEHALKLIPRETILAYNVIPLSQSGDMLVVGMVDPANPSAQEALKFLAKQEKVNLGVYLVTPETIREGLKKVSTFGNEIEAALQSLKSGKKEDDYSPQRVIHLEEKLGTGATEAPVIRIVSSLFKEAVNMEASDIHIEPQRSRTRIRFRIGGDLQEFTTMPAELGPALVARVKVLSNMRLDETRVPQDGRFRTIIFEKEIDFRVSTFPTPNGEKVALRVLDSAVGLKSLEDIGVNERNRKILLKGIARPYGMILLTGPTGSGKTTTLYALMQILNKAEVNVLSLEDPVEYTIEGVNQSQVHPEIGYTFASGLRQILRQDPDTIMVGEIRDNETAELAVHAALTGHIVLSTLHTNNAIGVIPRLVDMGVEPFLLPSALNLLAAQRLISRICQECKQGEPAPEGMDKVIARELEKLPDEFKSKYQPPFTIFRSPGCKACKMKGTAGRVAIFEIIEMTRELGSIIASRELDENKLLEEAKRQGVVSLRIDGILKALDGVVLLEEVLRETDEV